MIEPTLFLAVILITLAASLPPVLRWAEHAGHPAWGVVGLLILGTIGLWGCIFYVVMFRGMDEAPQLHDAGQADPPPDRRGPHGE